MNSQFAKNITIEEVAPLPLSQFNGKISVIETAEEIDEAVQILQIEKILGFDTETRPNFKKGHSNTVALLQISSQNHAFLFRLNKTGIPNSLKNLLENTSVEKAGIAIKDDLKALQIHTKFTPGGFIELQDFVKQFNIESNGLKKIAAIVLGVRISKSQQVTNWENPRLTEAQQIYAATDAWISLAIYKRLLSVN